MIKLDSQDPKKAVTDRFKLNKTIKDKRTEIVLEDTNSKSIHWMWNSESGTKGKPMSTEGSFCNYTKEEIEKIEKAFRGGQTYVWLGSVTTIVGYTPYFVNLEKMEQVNCNDNKRRRRVKRVIIQ
jgi:hypothetical protein